MIYTIEDVQTLVRSGETEFEQYGDVRTVEHDGLILFNYTPLAQYKGRWNYFEQISRGLILDRVTGEVVARPFDKFWNWGERICDADIVEATEKMDGSLGICFRNRGEYRIATRGSFTSDQALWATEYLNRIPNLNAIPDHLTLLFEVIYPENRVVVDYGSREDLVLIGARDRRYGHELYYQELKVIADEFGFSQPHVYQFETIRDVLLAAKDLSASAEGWVLRFVGGQRCKVKGDAYRIAHKVMTGISYRRVLDAVQSGALEQMIDGVPDEFLSKIKAWRDLIADTVYSTKQRVFAEFTPAPKASRKEFAQYVTKWFPSDQKYLFAMLDNRDITDLIYRHACVDLILDDAPMGEDS